MMSKAKFSLAEYENNPNKCTDLLASYLNEGSLGLVLGAGASRALNLPDWYDLVAGCYKTVFSGDSFPTKDQSTNEQLKTFSNQIKDQVGNDEYIKLVKQVLYKDVTFDLDYVKDKDLLISLASLIVGKTRGNIKNVITYNFDSVLEWYLGINGLKVQVTTLHNLIQKVSDLDIIHIHGYLPHNKLNDVITETIVLAKEEFEDRQIGDSYYKDLLMNFFRRQVFLSVGMSVASIIDDIRPTLTLLDKWYSTENIKRKLPYGIAFLTDCTLEQSKKLKEYKIIPCVLKIPDIYKNIFLIAQKAMNNKLS